MQTNVTLAKASAYFSKSYSFDSAKGQYLMLGNAKVMKNILSMAQISKNTVSDISYHY